MATNGQNTNFWPYCHTTVCYKSWSIPEMSNQKATQLSWFLVGRTPQSTFIAHNLLIRNCPCIFPCKMETSLKNKLHAFLISFRPNQNCFEMRLASEPQIQQSPFTVSNLNQNDSRFFEEVLLLFVMRAAAMTLIFLFTLVTHTHTSTD